MNTVLTVCSGLILIACAWALQRCIFHADRIRAHRARLEDVDAELHKLALKQESTLKQLQTLRGRFYAVTATPDDDEEVSTMERRKHGSWNALKGGPLVPLAAPFCANFGQAQLEGPTSTAASCECGYCAEMRDRRAAARKADLPRARLLTGGKANGSE
jgi:hypothetical protein